MVNGMSTYRYVDYPFSKKTVSQKVIDDLQYIYKYNLTCNHLSVYQNPRLNRRNSKDLDGNSLKKVDVCTHKFLWKVRLCRTGKPKSSNNK